MSRLFVVECKNVKQTDRWFPILAVEGCRGSYVTRPQAESAARRLRKKKAGNPSVFFRVQEYRRVEPQIEGLMPRPRPEPLPSDEDVKSS